MNTDTKTSINIEVACDAAKVIAALPADQKQILVGVLYGNASDFIQRANPAGGPAFKGFGGAFEVVPTITNTAVGGVENATSSGNLFLPATFAAVVKTELTKVLYPYSDKPEKKARGAIEFAALIFLARSEGADGFVWGMDWLKQPTSVDALASMKTAYAERIKSLTAPKAETAPDHPAPAKAKAKASA